MDLIGLVAYRAALGGKAWKMVSFAPGRPVLHNRLHLAH